MKSKLYLEFFETEYGTRPIDITYEDWLEAKVNGLQNKVDAFQKEKEQLLREIHNVKD